jgi:UDP-N-acetylmuramate--alanine ligase
MIERKKIKSVYFLGIGGIGMSAIARYFLSEGLSVFGYDKSESQLTRSLADEGCTITYDDDPVNLPDKFRDKENQNSILIIYTPAIPADNRIMSFFRDKGFKLYKRSEILGELSALTETIAVSGTHGKTTVSTMIAHIMKQSGLDCSAFLGGISKNYNSNLILGKGRFTVMEADEYDRSFHQLKPVIAVVTAVDADHLDIYGDLKTMVDAYNKFFSGIKNGGTLIANRRIVDQISVPGNIQFYTYGFQDDADFQAYNLRQKGDKYEFDLKTPEKKIHNIHFSIPGKVNIENAAAASAASLVAGVHEIELRQALSTFTGVTRRFDIRIKYPDIVYIDDYAHHPEEIKACITSVKEFFAGRKITGIFQPHLFSRTKDHASGFAEILDQLDEAILLPIYPAREKPIEGVSSKMIFDLMKSKRKQLLDKDDIPGKLDIENIDVLLTIGAGDIDRLVEPIEKEIEAKRKK